MSQGFDREAAVDRLLRQSFKNPAAAAPRGPCLDPEILAAWVDGTLKSDDLKVAEAHLSECTRCLTLMATMTKIAPKPAPVNRWWGSGTLRWLVPLTAGAAALLVWIAVPNDEPRRSLEQTIARTEAVPVAPAEQGPTAEQRPLVESDEGLRNRSAEKRSDDQQVERKDAPAKPAGARDVAKENGPTRQEPATVSELPSTLQAEAASRASPAPPPAPPAAAPAAPVAAPEADQATAARGVGQLSTTSGETVAQPQGAPPASVAARSAELRRANSNVGFTEILSPDSTLRWRAGARGFLQLSQNSGATWEPLKSGVMVDLIAGASPLPSVCWLVGRAGTVLLTTDGRSWQRLTFPESVDLTSVRAIDARRATVTTSDARMFTTADGGLTWTR